MRIKMPPIVALIVAILATYVLCFIACGTAIKLVIHHPINPIYYFGTPLAPTFWSVEFLLAAIENEENN